MAKKIATVVLLIVFILDLFFVWMGNNESRFFTKTLLLPLLILIYFVSLKQLGSSTTLRLNRTFVTGLFLSFLGDFFLLFDWGFLPGLGSFLTAHMFYIFTFKKLKQLKISELWFFGVSIYVATLLVYLFPALNEMKMPVVLYAIVIGVMFLNALKTKNRLLILGAFLFVISDTLLAVNLFVNSDKILSVLVMITYVFAQLFLVFGMLSNPEKLQNSGN